MLFKKPFHPKGLFSWKSFPRGKYVMLRPPVILLVFRHHIWRKFPIQSYIFNTFVAAKQYTRRYYGIFQ